ncbi:MAG: ATP-binding protein [Myxococcota bacterium]
MPLTRISLERFTAFEKLDLTLSPGINVFIGANGTGKTHLMKVMYASCDVSKTGMNFADKLINVFLPSKKELGRLVKRKKGSSKCSIRLYRDGGKRLRTIFSNHATLASSADVKGVKKWGAKPLEATYIPVKEMLANAPRFRALYSSRDLHFEEVYADIIDRAFRPMLRGPISEQRRKLLNILQKEIEGKVSLQEEEFFLRNKQGNLEFTLLAEGIRKLGLIWLLIQNETLFEGAVLFWDEPETNLNPKLFRTLIEILLNLQREGVQIFLATHDYVILKELDLQKKKSDKVKFHSLYHDGESKEICCHTADNYLDIHPNAIAEAFTDLYDREVKKDLKGLIK